MNSFEGLSLLEQLGNVGSEVGRAEAAKAGGDKEKEQLAATRALDLLDRVVADPRWRPRLKEIVRARNLVADYFFGINEFNSKGFEKYFYQFALASRLKR